jgi:hypothetical protein
MKKAVLNKDKILIGFEEVRELKKGDIDGGDGDLNIDRGYKWTGKTFQAIGSGYGKPKSLPKGVTMEYAIYLLMKSAVEGKEPPDECAQWVKWFENNLKKRQEEELKKGRRN